MSIIDADDLALLQADAESEMCDECLIERPDSAAFGGPPVTVYDGKCEVRMFGRAATDQPEPGGMTSDEHRCMVKIPASAVGVQFNDHVTITASVSPPLVGFDVFVADIHTASKASSQRLLCKRSLR